jgi:3-methyladenine DNA glycosylase AlkD
MALWQMECEEVLERLKSRANPENVAGMARFGINPENTLGISVPTLRKLAKEIGRDHALAQELWASGVHEARMLAGLIDDPRQVTEEQMERWVADFDSWDVCDGCCGDLFDKTEFAYRKAVEWAGREEKFVKRAGFALMAWLAVHDKRAPDEAFAAFLPVIKRESADGRNFVKKAVNWALRQIGKRSAALNAAAIRTAQEIQQMGSKPGRWISSDARRELTSEKVRGRLHA